MTDKMKPCPFCATQKPAIPDGDVHYVVCRSCESEGPVGSSRRAAIEAWNTRPAPVDPQLQATMDGIKEVLRSDMYQRGWKEAIEACVADVEAQIESDKALMDADEVSKHDGFIAIATAEEILEGIRALPLPTASTGSEQ